MLFSITKNLVKMKLDRLYLSALHMLFGQAPPPVTQTFCYTSFSINLSTTGVTSKSAFLGTEFLYNLHFQQIHIYVIPRISSCNFTSLYLRNPSRYQHIPYEIINKFLTFDLIGHLVPENKSFSDPWEYFRPCIKVLCSLNCSQN